MLLIIGEEAGSLSASGPVETKKEVNLPSNMQIVFEEDLLSVSLKDAELKEILKEISRQRNITVSSEGTIKGKVTLKFVKLPLEQGLKRILKNHNYSFSYSKTRNKPEKETRYVLTGIFLLEKSIPGRRENGHGPRFSETPGLSPVSDEALKLFTETVKRRSDQMNNKQLIELLKRFGKPENEELESEAKERFVREAEAFKKFVGERAKIKQMAPTINPFLK
jgi:hypothetical protein